ncbi:MAG: T9SS type A sorting domain-containing protein [Bacteroidales bacterium]|nr:T9SS type A sorting domain-containing protein [Bacteroidales bacterium]
MKKTLLWILIFGYFTVKGQDTLTVMQYNLLNYGNYTSYCTHSNNSETAKNGYIATIVHYVNPDILTVNEMAASATAIQNLLDNSLNTNGVTKYSVANFIRQDLSSYLVNALYYNHDKLGLAGHTIAQSTTRDVDVFKLYYKSSTLDQGDTVFIYCVSAHLKAGSYTSDANERATMAANTMNYLTTHDPNENYMIMGDFNLYNSDEAAYQILTTNSTLHFNDPVNQAGDWHNNSQYALYHTQSTHTTSSGCASTGGMDDRFDFILISDNIKNNNKKVQYIPGTYHAVGQDGLHFNSALNVAPEDTAAPSNVISALYNNSDHLPVTLKVRVDVATGIHQWSESSFERIKYANPVSNTARFTVQVNRKSTLQVDIYSLLGQKEMKQEFALDRGWQNFNMDVSRLPRGIYIVRFTDKNNDIQYSQKLIKQ